MSVQTNKDNLSLGELFGELSKETSRLVRKEVELARVEMTQKAAQIGREIGMLAVGGAVLYAGLLALLAALIIGLGSLGVPWWLSALLVGLVVSIIGFFLVQRGRDGLKRANLAPQQTIETLKEDAEWAAQQTR
jgi:xanthine/uracil permease